MHGGIQNNLGLTQTVNQRWFQHLSQIVIQRMDRFGDHLYMIGILCMKMITNGGEKELDFQRHYLMLLSLIIFQE